MSKALELFKTLFDGPRDPRSAEYQEGCLYILRRKLDGIGHFVDPFKAERSRRFRASDNFGGVIKNDFIDQSGFQHRSVQLAAAFKQNRADFKLP